MTVVADEVVVFTVSRRKNPTYRRVLWRMWREDAKKICSDERTSGQNYMLCWTFEDIDDPEVNRYIPDNGMHADVLREHEVTVLDSAEMRRTGQRTQPAAA